MSGTPAGFTRNDKNVFNLYRLCQIYLEDGSPELLAEISRRLSSSYITHNFPPYFVNIKKKKIAINLQKKKKISR